MSRLLTLFLLAALSACAPHDPAADRPKDPVCGKLIDPATAIYLRYDRWDYWFDSEACKGKFLERPARYVDMTRYTFSNYD